MGNCLESKQVTCETNRRLELSTVNPETKSLRIPSIENILSPKSRKMKKSAKKQVK